MNPDCILIGNGGINSYDDCLEKTAPNKNIGIMIGQAAIGNPRVFTDHLPSRKERLEISLRHLHLMSAYEVYLQHTRLQFPEVSDQIAINRKHLHMLKKYDPDSDEKIDLPQIERHDYNFPMPNTALLNDYAQKIKKGIQCLTIMPQMTRRRYS